jgi:hypothetical protein
MADLSTRPLAGGVLTQWLEIRDTKVEIAEYAIGGTPLASRSLFVALQAWENAVSQAGQARQDGVGEVTRRGRAGLCLEGKPRLP